MGLPKLDLTKLISGLFQSGLNTFEQRWLKMSDKGEAYVKTAPESENAYGNHARYKYLPIDQTAANIAVGTLAFESGDISIYNQLDFVIVSPPTTGIEILISRDGVNYEASGVSVIDLSTGLLVTGAALTTINTGSFSLRNLNGRKVKINQLGAGNAMRIRGGLGNK